LSAGKACGGFGAFRHGQLRGGERLSRTFKSALLDSESNERLLYIPAS
jgi:hypothetical protein